MTETGTGRALRTALAEETHGHHLDPAVGVRAATCLGTRRGPGRLLAVAATLVGVLAVAAVYALTRPAAHDIPAGATNCAGAVVTGPLPTWARAGFTPPDSAVAHVTSTGGGIVAILFVDPLRVHQPAGTFNKVLWSARESTDEPLLITATRGAQRVTRRVDGGPGPSYLDLPDAGCWYLDLAWGTHHDTMYLPVSP